MKAALALLLAAVVVTSVVASDPTHVFPAELEEWSLPEWEAMSERDQWFFVHGYLFGLYVVYAPAVDSLFSGPSPDVNRLMDYLEGLEPVLRTDANDLTQQIDSFYRRTRADVPMFLIPTQVATPMGDRHNF